MAAFTNHDVERLLKDTSIIRNRKKIEAVIYNAQQIIAMRTSHGGFARWIDVHHPLPIEEWVKLFKKTFKFTGGAIVNEFLISIGYLHGAHEPDCAVFEKIRVLGAAWQKTCARTSSNFNSFIGLKRDLVIDVETNGHLSE